MTKTIVIGHKNPDTDSIVSAVCYANFKTELGESNIFPASSGFPNVRTEYLFDKFGVDLPQIIKDITPRVVDIMNFSPITLRTGQVLLEAMELFQKHQLYRIPVVNKHGFYKGMLSLFNLSNKLFLTPTSDVHETSASLLGRKVKTTINLAARTLDAKKITGHDERSLETLHVYVAAMSPSRFTSHILKHKPDKLIIVVSDREDIQLMAAKLKVRLLIITGNYPISKKVIEVAKSNKTSILQTNYDSAATIRRLKFSSPVEYMFDTDVKTFSSKDKLLDIKHAVMSSFEDTFPVTNSKGKLKGIFTKNDIESKKPINLILVDHNNLEQAVEGASEVPIIEILDHHHIDMPITHTPITVLNDVVGSTSTLIAEKFKYFAMTPSKKIAGLLMGGIISDTIFLKSPTTTRRDKDIINWLEPIAKTSAKKLANEMLSVGSIIINSTPKQILTSDKKNYTAYGFNFSIAQVEEISFDSFYAKYKDILAELDNILHDEKLHFLGLLVTNIVSEDSLLLINGKQQILDTIPYPKIKNNLFDLSSVVSRKKQLIPELTNVLADL